jgi:hypothetical protein
MTRIIARGGGEAYADLVLKGIEETFPTFEAPAFHWTEEETGLRLRFLAPYRLHIGRVFYDLVSRWLLPPRRIDIPSFISVDFSLPDLGEQLYTFAEIAVHLGRDVPWEEVRHNLKILDAEIRLGLVSVYHASRLLEVPLPHASEKSPLIQERVSLLIERRPDEIDYDIFGEMQSFLVMSREEFKAPRDATHLSRLIALFYLFRKSLERDTETSPERRPIRLKIGRISLEALWGQRHVCGICLGTRLVRSRERFEESHLIQAIHSILPDVVPVDGSFFSSEGEEGSVRILYLEIEAKGGEISRDDLSKLRRLLPTAARERVEVMARPLFMPRNEEEVIRSIVTLARELHFIRDLPQVVVLFDAQDEGLLSFHVILVRLLLPDTRPLEELFHRKETSLRYFPEQEKRVGLLRKRYPKEALVFRLAFSSDPFLRDDRSVDLYRARQWLIEELQNVVGEVRDYNGGMISKEIELLGAVKTLIGPMRRTDEVLLEALFHAIAPLEMRALLSPLLLKHLFTTWSHLISSPEEESVSHAEGDLFSLASRRDLTARLAALPKTPLIISRPLFAGSRFTAALYVGSSCDEQEKIRALLDFGSSSEIELTSPC